MPADHERAREYFQKLRDRLSIENPQDLLLPDEEQVTTASRIAGASRIDAAAVERRWSLLQSTTASAGAAREQLLDAKTIEQMPEYAANIENFIGTAKVPIGLAGPLRVRGLHARGDYYVPLATTEAALIASYARGAQVISEAGGCAAAIINEGVGRAPVFAFDSLVEAGQFIGWVIDHVDDFRREANATTRFGRFQDLKITLEGNHVYLLMEFTTRDAAGQNMVTIAAEAVCRWIESHTPVQPKYWFVEGNMSGDKKAAVQSFQSVRGRKVTAEVVLPTDLVKRRLHTTPARMVDYYRVSSLGGMMSGNIGIQGHYANGLAAMYIACGQDAACVAESSVGITRMEQRDDGALYVAVTLPNLIIGTVGGGTGLPTQNACLNILGLAGIDKAAAFAEVCAALLMAGEVSLIGAMAAGQFTRAHRKRARGERSE